MTQSYLFKFFIYGKKLKKYSKENTKFRSLNTVNLNQRNYCYEEIWRKRNL